MSDGLEHINYTWPRSMMRAYVNICSLVGGNVLVSVMVYGVVVYPDGGNIGFNKESFVNALKNTGYTYLGCGQLMTFNEKSVTVVDIRVSDDDDTGEWIWVNLDNCIVMPSLAKYDNEGLFIYDGDIIKYSYVWGIAEDDKKVFLDKEIAYGVVEWDSRVSGYYKMPHNVVLDTDKMIIEVIGNKYNNHSLMDKVNG